MEVDSLIGKVVGDRGRLSASLTFLVAVAMVIGGCHDIDALRLGGPEGGDQGDIDECQLAIGPCKANSTCTNTAGGYACPCDEGFHGDGQVECSANVGCDYTGSRCIALATCRDVDGIARCICNDGYTGDGSTCTAIADQDGGADSGGADSGGADSGGADSGGAGECAINNGAGTIDVAGDGTQCAKIVQVAAGYYYTCAITTLGTLYCWGRNAEAQLGDGTTTERHVPKLVSGGFSDWSSVSVRDSDGCGVRAGRLYCWGYNASGQLGDGTTTKRNVPTLVSGGFTDWSSVSVGVEHTCGLRAGMLYCWGKNTYGRLGDSTTMARHVPTPVSGGFADWQSVSAGDLHTCGVRAGQMYCWGYNNDGQLGDSTTTERDVPTPVSGGFTDWASVSTGGAHSCGKRVALTYQGHLYCWGSNTYGQLGDGTTMERDVPTPVSGGLTDEWQSVSAGGSHTCGANADQLYCWGNNASGRLGDGTTTERDVPTLVIGDFVDWWPSVSAGDHSCGVHGDPGLLYCWGGNESGELGNGTTAVGPTSAPQPIVRP